MVLYAQMGRVFSFDEIEAGRVPKPEYFDSAKHMTLGWMDSMLENGEIEGGLVFGSVASGTASIRSDFDMVLVINDYTVPQRIRSLRDLIKAAFHIPMEPILIPLELAHTSLHSLDSDFLFHMSKVGDENVVGRHPVSLIKPNNPDIIEVHTGYLASKLRKFRDGFFIEGQDAKLKTLQRALEAPVSIGRRTLRTIGIPQEDTDGNFNDTKKNVTRLFRQHFGDTRLGNGFDACLAQDAEYSALLKAAMQGEVSRHEYDEYVTGEGYDFALTQSLAWTSDISLFFHRTVEGNMTQIEGQSGRKETL